MKKITLLAAFVAIVFTLVGPATVLAADPTGSEPKSPEAIASIYVVDLVATAAFGVAMNDAGDVTGTSYPDPGCGSTCLPPLETVVWKGGQRIVLPSVPGLSGVTTSDINNLGWISGFGGSFGFGHAAAWRPNGSTYTPIDMGLLPGTTSSNAIGIDDNNRAVGYAATSSGGQTPFKWTEAGGMVNLTTQGFPGEIPLGLSRGGSVATCSYWYRLDDPGSVTAMPAPPQGWLRGCGSVAINDAGDQARFNSQTGDPEHLVYPFRFNHEGTWQQIGFAGTGHLSAAGVGSINGARDITATVQSDWADRRRSERSLAGPRCSRFAGLCRKRPHDRRIDERERANPGPDDHRPIRPALGEIGSCSAMHQQLHPGDQYPDDGEGPSLLRSGVRPCAGHADSEERGGRPAVGREGYRPLLRRLLAR